jgi:hypothetical protein
MKLNQTLENLFKSKYFIWLSPVLVYLVGYTFVYSDIIFNINTNIGTPGSTYQNIYAYFMYLLNFKNGEFLSLEGSQFTWYGSVLSANEISHAPALIFGLFYFIFKNYVIAFNLLVIFYTLLLQYSIFLLLKRWTNNWWVSVILPLSIILTGAWSISYTSHIHTLLLAGIFLLIYALENFIFDKKRSWEWILLIIVSTWLWVFSSAHSLSLGSLTLSFWLIYNIYGIYKFIRFETKSFFKLAGIEAVSMLPFIFFIINFLQASNVYSESLRTPYRVAATNFNADFFSYTIPFINLSLKIVKNLFTSFEFDIFNYPDGFSNLSFVFGIILFIPILLYFLIKKKTLPKSLYWFGVFLFLYTIAVGPFFKVKNNELDQLTLPHYYLFQAFFPIQIIRAAWRFNLLGFIALIFSTGIALSEFIKSIESSKSRKLTKKIKKILKTSIISICFLIVLLSTSNIKASPLEAYEENKFLTNYFDSSLDNDQNIDFFYYTAPQATINTAEEPYRSISLTIGKYNLNKGYQAINWVTGAGLGAPAQSEDIFILLTKKGYQKAGVEILFEKQVDAVKIDKDKNDKLLDIMSIYYDKVLENNESTIWERKSDQIQTNIIDNLTLDFATSNTAQINTDHPVFININNESDLVYVNPEKTKLLRYSLEIEQNSNTLVKEEIEITKDPFYLSNQGKTIKRYLKTKNLNEGRYQLILRDDSQNILHSQEIELLNQENFTQKINQSKNRPLSYQAYQTSLNFKREDFLVRNLKASFEISEGVIEAKDKTIRSDLEYDFSLVFKDRNNQDQVYPVFGQVNFFIEGVYFPGDKIDVWMTQYLPEITEEKDLIYKLQIEKRPEISKRQKIINSLKSLRNL